jgi:enediyne polyketide synthase
MTNFNSKNTKIAIVGLGCNYPGSKDLKSFWQNILAKRQQFRNMPNCRLPMSDYYHPDKAHPDTTYGKRAALIDGFDFDWKKHRITKTSFESTDIVHWLALDTTMKAFADAGFDTETMPKKRTGVIIGNSLNGEFSRSEGMRLRWPYIKRVLNKTAEKFSWSKEKLDEFENEMEFLYKSVFADVTEDSLAGGLANVIAGRICNFFNFNGGGYTVDGACSSSLLAIITAANSLVNQDLDIAVAGGVDISLDTLELIGFSKAGALSDSEMRVYDKNRNGFIPGEGCGIVILKRLEDAQKNNDKIYAILEGWGVSSDGKGGITAPSADGQSYALIKAYEKAGISPQNLSFVEGHGTGTALGDTTELNAIKKTYEHFLQNDSIKKCAMTSAKSIFGHTKAAAGVAAFIKTTIALNQRVTPPTSGIKNIHEFFRNEKSPLYPALCGKQHDSVIYAGVSAMGFGGINSHVVLSSSEKIYDQFTPKLTLEQLSISVQDSELFLFSADNSKELLETIKKSQELSLGLSIAELADFAKFNNEKIDFDKKFKAALVAKSHDDLQFLLEKLIENITEEKFKEETIIKIDELPIYLTNSSKKHRLGFLFPGQGSQKINSAKSLINRFSWAREISQKIDNDLLNKLFCDLEKISSDELEKEITQNLTKSENAQVSVVLSSLLWLEFLKKLGIKPDAVAGHSLGELMALYEVGAFNIEELIANTILRGQAMGNTKTIGTMVSLFCNETEAKKIISNVDDAEIANINSPEQTVISGTREAIAKVIDLAEKSSITSYPLAVGNAFHSKLMTGAANYFTENFKANKKFNNESGIAFYSSMSGKKVDDVVILKDHLGKQILSSVRFVGMIEEMAKELDFLVEVGPGKILGKLVNKITNKLPCSSIETEIDSFFDLNNTLASLFVRNFKINISEIYKDRLIVDFRSPSTMQFITNPLEKPLGGDEMRNSFFDANKEFAKIENKESQEISQKDISDVEKTLIEMVAKKTGFDISSISLNNRILDDLNLDSIKSAELIGNAARTFGATQISITKFANSTLQEVADALKQSSSSNNKEEVIDINENWVKTFELKESKKEIFDDVNSGAITKKDFSVIDFSMLSWDQDLARISGNFNSHKEGQRAIENLLIIFPKEKLSYDKFDVKNRVKLISKLNQINFKNLKSLNVIHFDNEIDSLFSSIALENSELKVRIFNINETIDKSYLLRLITNKLEKNDRLINARYDERNEYVRRPYLAFLENFETRNISWTNDDTIVVSAGAKGITKECVLNWARNNNVKAKFALLGRSDSQDKEVLNSLSEFAAANINCRYYSCDIADEISIQNTFVKIKKDLGKISGIIHGAGLNSPRTFDKVSYEEALKEISPKLIGIINILNNCKALELKLITAISSIIGFSGMQGNAWYAWSNRALEKILLDYKNKNSNIQTCVIGYSVWGEIGMGARMGSVEQLGHMGVLAIPKEKGLENFANLMNKKIGDDQYVVTSRVEGLISWNPENHVKPGADRFLEEIIHFEPKVELISQANLYLEKDLYLKDHDFNGSILMPTVFGLEAMAQGVAYTLGIKGFDGAIAIENIELKKPIIIDKDHGLAIQIKVFVESLSVIKVNIADEKSNFIESNFSAVFNLEKINLPKFDKIEIAEKINIDPKKDLYGSLLFQGESFQKLDSIYKLSSEEVVYKINNKADMPAFSREFSQELLLGSPFNRDVLLQSAQLAIPRYKLLPITIKKIIINNNSRDEVFAKLTLNSSEKERDFDYNVLVFNQNNELLELLENYTVRRVESGGDSKIFPQDLANPSNYEENKLRNLLTNFANENSLELPAIKLNYENSLISLDRDVRHKKELPIFNSAIKEFAVSKNLTIKDEDFSLNWLESGKPVVVLKDNKNLNIEVSLSHDDEVCICSASNYSHGCDVEPIEYRTEYQWSSLLNGYSKKFAELSEIMDKNEAGTILWSIIESVKKTGLFKDDEKLQITLIKNEKDIFLFRCGNNEHQIPTIATIFSGVRVNKKIYSLTLKQKNEDKAVIESPKAIHSNHELEIENEIFSGKKRGQFGEETYIHRFKTTFKEANQIDRTIHYPNYAFWMGQLRELPLSRISKDLVRDMTSGKWGMVTNSSYIKIIEDAKAFDLIEGRFWVSRCYGKLNSTVDLIFEWCKVEGSNVVPIAYSFLPTTWVKILDHGIVETEKFPKYFQDFIDDISAKNYNEDYLSKLKETKNRYDRGKLIFTNNKPSAKKTPLHTLITSTSLNESNLVGNIYYGNYYKWQAESFDEFIYKIDPTFYQTLDRKFSCIETEVQHLREAMPFDKIEARLYIDNIYEMGFDVSCDFYCNSRKEVEKLASSKQKVAFLVKENENYELKTIPNKILEHFR